MIFYFNKIKMKELNYFEDWIEAVEGHGCKVLRRAERGAMDDEVFVHFIKPYPTLRGEIMEDSLVDKEVLVPMQERKEFVFFNE